MLYGDTEAFFQADKVTTDLTGVYVPKVMRDPRFAPTRRSRKSIQPRAPSGRS
jgi:hypothetical protein